SSLEAEQPPGELDRPVDVAHAERGGIEVKELAVVAQDVAPQLDGRGGPEGVAAERRREPVLGLGVVGKALPDCLQTRTPGNLVGGPEGVDVAGGQGPAVELEFLVGGE